MEKKIWVSDVIDQAEIEKWTNGDVIAIKAKTGDGKSYFIKNKLYEYAKARGDKILLLLHRENTINQFRNEIVRDGKEDTIHIRSYQYLEQSLIHRRPVDIGEYRYIVVDEAHYFVADSLFNNRTDLSFEEIMNQNNSIRIFMSATIENIQEFLNVNREIETINYEIPQNYQNIKSLTFFNKDDTMVELAKQILERNEKAIFFINNATKAYKFYKSFQTVSLFNCSKSNSLHRYVDDSTITEMLNNERFETPFLITTSCFDAGANIADESVRNIIIDMKDAETIIQCAGRKRAQSVDDTFNLYIKNVTNQQLGGFASFSNRQLEMVRYLSEHSAEELLEKYPRQDDVSGVIYDTVVNGQIEKRVNQLKYRKKIKDIETYRNMKNLGEYGFSKYLAMKFGFYNESTKEYDYLVASEDYGLRKYLERMVGVVMLTRNDRKKLIDILNIRQDGHKLKGINAVNAALEERGLPYKVKEFSTSRIVEGKKKNYKSAWCINRKELEK